MENHDDIQNSSLLVLALLFLILFTKTILRVSVNGVGKETEYQQKEILNILFWLFIETENFRLFATNWTMFSYAKKSNKSLTTLISHKPRSKHLSVQSQL